MAKVWQANLNTIEPAGDGRLHLGIVYFTDTEKVPDNLYEFPPVATKSWLEDQAIKRIATFAEPSDAEKLVVGPIDVTPPQPPVPDPDQVAATEFLRLVHLWVGKRVMVAEALLPQADADAAKTAVSDFYTAAKTDAQKLVYEGIMANELRAFIALGV